MAKSALDNFVGAFDNASKREFSFASAYAQLMQQKERLDQANRQFEQISMPTERRNQMTFDQFGQPMFARDLATADFRNAALGMGNEQSRLTLDAAKQYGLPNLQAEASQLGFQSLIDKSKGSRAGMVDANGSPQDFYRNQFTEAEKANMAMREFMKNMTANRTVAQPVLQQPAVSGTPFAIAPNSSRPAPSAVDMYSSDQVGQGGQGGQGGYPAPNALVSDGAMYDLAPNPAYAGRGMMSPPAQFNPLEQAVPRRKSASDMLLQSFGNQFKYNQFISRGLTPEQAQIAISLGY